MACLFSNKIFMGGSKTWLRHPAYGGPPLRDLRKGAGREGHRPKRRATSSRWRVALPKRASAILARRE